MSNQVDDLVIGSQKGQQPMKRGMRGPHDHDIAALQRIAEIGNEQAGQMREMLHGEAPIAADETRKLQVQVVDRDLKSLANEPFREFDQGALPQVVGIWLECQSQDRNPALAIARDHPEDPIDLMLVGGESGVEHEAWRIEGLGVIA